MEGRLIVAEINAIVCSLMAAEKKPQRYSNLVRFFLAVAKVKDLRINHYFSIGGCLFLSCDKNFGVIKQTNKTG